MQISIIYQQRTVLENTWKVAFIMKVAVVPSIQKSLAIWLELEPSKQKLICRFYSPSECNCLCHLRFITARDKQRLVSIYNTYVPSYCSIEISLDALGGLVHFDIQFLSTVHKSESTQAKGNMFLLKYQLVSGIPKDPKKLTYPSHKLQVTQVQALLKPDNKFTIFINIHSPPPKGRQTS